MKKNVCYFLSLLAFATIFGCQKSNLEPTQGPALQGPQVIVNASWVKYHQIQLSSFTWEKGDDWRQAPAAWSISGKAYALKDIDANLGLSSNIYLIFRTLYIEEYGIGASAVLYSPSALTKTSKTFTGKLGNWLKFNQVEIRKLNVDNATSLFSNVVSAPQKSKKQMLDATLNQVDFAEKLEPSPFMVGIEIGDVLGFKTANGKKGLIKCVNFTVKDDVSPVTWDPVKKGTLSLEMCYLD